MIMHEDNYDYTAIRIVLHDSIRHHFYSSKVFCQELETTKNGFDNKMAQLENVVCRIVQPSYAYFFFQGKF